MGPLFSVERSLTVTSTDARARAQAARSGHRSGGPRPDVTAEPLDFGDLRRDRADRAVSLAGLLPCPSGKGARGPLELRPWQKEIIDIVLAPGIRTAVVAIPRGGM